MSQSTNAILFYGYCWAEEGVELFDDDNGDREWTVIVLESRGEKDPWDDYPKEYEQLPYREKEAKSQAWIAAHREAIDEWYAKIKAVSEEFGVEVDSHCSGDCPMPYVAVRSSVLMASRGNPEEVTASLQTPSAEELERLESWMTTMGVDKPHSDSKWWLVSDWN